MKLRTQAEGVEFSREDAFIIYSTFAGDLERTAHALGVKAVDVLRVADEEHWNDRLRPILELKKSARPGDFERAMNRALNFSQAHRFRLFLERTLQRLSSARTDDELAAILTKRVKTATKETEEFTARPIADLAAALQACHNMSYAALNDTVGERMKRNDTPEAAYSASELHQKIAEEMAKIRDSDTPRALLFDAQLKVGQHIAEQTRKENLTPEKVKSPYDHE